MDRTDLVPVTASIFWLCKNDPDREKHYLEPGTCRDGLPREKAFEVRPHGDHNPRHGGPSVFMSEDLFHHVEATLVAPTKTRPAIFRVYFYDEYTRPIKATGVSAQVAPADKNGKRNRQSCRRSSCRASRTATRWRCACRTPPCRARARRRSSRSV